MWKSLVTIGTKKWTNKNLINLNYLKCLKLTTFSNGIHRKKWNVKTRTENIERNLTLFIMSNQRYNWYCYSLNIRGKNYNVFELDTDFFATRQRFTLLWAKVFAGFVCFLVPEIWCKTIFITYFQLISLLNIIWDVYCIILNHSMPPDEFISINWIYKMNPSVRIMKCK